MNKLSDYILDNYWVEVCDEHGQKRDVTLREASRFWYKDQHSKDQSLGISRPKTPMDVVTISEDLPHLYEFKQLEEDIKAIAYQLTLAPETSQQAYYLRCLQFYWDVKAIRLANLIIPIIKDPVQPGEPFEHTLPKIATRNLIVDTDTDKALYDLLQAGKSHILAWADQNQLDYPFQVEGDDITDLFLHILKMRFQRDLQGNLFNIQGAKPNKEEQKRHFRRWLKFLSDLYDGESEEPEYIKVLWSMEWEGYSLLALKQTKQDKLFKKLWQRYLKASRATICCFDTDFYWHDGIPYQTRGTRTKHPVEAVVTADGYINWHLLNKS